MGAIAESIGRRAPGRPRHARRRRSPARCAMRANYTPALYAHLTRSAAAVSARSDRQPAALGSGSRRLVPGVLVPALRGATIRAVRVRPRGFATPMPGGTRARVPHATRWELPLPDWDGIRRLSRCDARRHARRARASRRRRALFLRARALSRGHARRSAAHDAADARACRAAVLRRSAREPLGASGRCHRAAAVGSRLGAARGRGRAIASCSTTRSGATTSTLAPFAIARRCVTQDEFAAFVDDDGYARPTLWSRSGMALARRRASRCPRHWRRTARATGSDGDSIAGSRSIRSAAGAATSTRSRPKRTARGPVAVCRPRRNGNTLPADGLLSTPGAVWEWTATPVSIAVSGLCRRSVRGLLGAVVRRPSRAARRLVCDATAARPSAISQLLPAGTPRHVRRLPDLRASLTFAALQQTLRNTHVLTAVGDRRGFPPGAGRRSIAAANAGRTRDCTKARARCRRRRDSRPVRARHLEATL